MSQRRKVEKEIWALTKPLLPLPPTSVGAVQNSEGMRQYMNARRIISEAVKDPIFVKRMQEHKATLRDMLMQDFDAETFAKLFNTDIRACVPDKQKKKDWL